MREGPWGLRMATDPRCRTVRRTVLEHFNCSFVGTPVMFFVLNGFIDFFYGCKDIAIVWCHKSVGVFANSNGLISTV
jgi:hypothetical protein